MAHPRAHVLVNVIASLLAAVAARAQTVWTVTGVNGIQAAINAASPGDVLVLTGSGGSPDYFPFTLNKGLTIRGNGARIGSPSGAPSIPIDVNVPPGQVAHIERIETLSNAVPTFGWNGCPVIVSGGSVRFERCTLRARLQVDNATVVVSGGTTTGFSGNAATEPGIQATASRVNLRDCVVTGSNGICAFYPSCSPAHPARPAVVAIGGELQAERVQFTGGSGGIIIAPGAPAVQVTGTLTRIADCTLTAGNGTQAPGGTALVNNGGWPVDLRSTVLVLGLGFPNGAPSSGPANPNAPLLRLALVPAWTRGATSTLTCNGDANTLFALAVAPDVQPVSVSVIVEPVWFTSGFTVGAGVLDATGRASFPVNVPNAPSLQHLTVWCQAIAGNSLPLRASTLAGGVVQ